MRRIVLILCVCTSFLLFSENSLQNRYKEAANVTYQLKEIEKSYVYINQALDLQMDEDIDTEFKVLAENIYYEYLLSILNDFDREKYLEITENLANNNFLASERILDVVNVLKEQFNSEDKEVKKEKKVNSDSHEYKLKLETNKKHLKKIEEQLQAAKLSGNVELEDKLEIERSLLTNQIELYTSMINQEKSRQKIESRTVLFAFCIILLFIVIIIVIIWVALKITAYSNSRQQAQFGRTLENAAKVNDNAITKKTVKIDEYKYVGVMAHDEMSDEEYDLLKKLSNKCSEIGVEIDKATGRKNNSRNVSELVFKVSHELKLGSFDSMVYYCAAMIYDIGFLQIDKKILQKSVLNNEEKISIREHVQLGLSQISFLPEELKGVFSDAILTHHENIDGSGYPKKLKGLNIPIIGRIIRVVESYVALISVRNYRGIFDQESALKELKSTEGIYDERIIEALASVV